MLRRFLMIFPGLCLVYVATCPTLAGASLGTLTLLLREGTVTWAASVECTAGDEIEIDVFITQGQNEAFLDANIVCPWNGPYDVSVTTNPDGEDDRLHPGRADVLELRTDYMQDGDGELGEVHTSEHHSEVLLRPNSG